MAQNRSAANIGQMLLREGLITENQLRTALRTQSDTEKPLGRILVEMGLISENVKLDFMRRKTGYPTVVLSDESIDPQVLKMIPKQVAMRFHVIPVRFEQNGLLVAMEDPTDVVALDRLAEVVPMPIRPAIASASEIEEALDVYSEATEAEAGAEALPLHIRQPTWYRVVRYLFMPIFMLGPLLLFVLLLSLVPSFAEALLQADWAHDPFDVFLYTLLGWGLWSVIVFEINGLLFGSKPPPKESE